MKNFSDYLNEQKSERSLGQPFKIAFPLYKGDLRGIADRIVEFYEYFPPNGTFNSINAAEAYLKEEGYNYGSMEMNSPIAFYKGNIIGKWRNLRVDERETIDGVLIPDPDFREGGTHIVFFKFPQ